MFFRRVRRDPQRRVLTIPKAEAIIGGSLSRPSKMPCPAWDISERECRRGSHLAAKSGTICSAYYARRGHSRVLRRSPSRTRMSAAVHAESAAVAV